MVTELSLVVSTLVIENLFPKNSSVPKKMR
jgi:hypothetical protein